MDDLISRQAAIDVLWGERERLDSYMDECLKKELFALRAGTKAERNRIEEDIEIITSLPSAQPELIRCKDCVCWDTSWKPTRAIEGAYWCSNNDIYMEADDYCSLAERKEE